MAVHLLCFLNLLEQECQTKAFRAGLLGWPQHPHTICSTLKCLEHSPQLGPSFLSEREVEMGHLKQEGSFLPSQSLMGQRKVR